MKDIHGWTALFHCTSAGHQQMVKFLLDSGANANLREPTYGFTPLMEAAASGHEIIVQYLLNHGVKVDVGDYTGATARALAMKYGHMKIVDLIDIHTASLSKTLYRNPEKYEDLSSSDESCSVPQRQRPLRKMKGLSIHEGPQALAKITAIGIGGRMHQPCCEPPQGYVTFNNNNEGNSIEGEDLRYRDVTSPINEQDVESSSSREENPFCTNLLTIRSSSSSSEGLAKALGVSSEASLESNEDSDHSHKSSVRKQTKSYTKAKNRYSNNESQWPPSSGTSGIPTSPGSIFKPERPTYSGPQDLATLLEQIGCLKYLQVFEEQDVDLRIFLTLTESDLKEIGITLFGPKRKMTSAIARWHSNARPPSDALELAYADRLEAEMQELAIQLHKRYEELEILKGQVSQEQELRAIVESCLMEQNIAMKGVQTQLEETQTVTRDFGLILDQLKACQIELSSRIKEEDALGRVSTTKAHMGAGFKGWQASLKSMSLSELSGALEDCVSNMGKALCSMSQSLEKLQVLNGKQNWREP
ncbi:ankyrin repeat and SAM domain-containing protein 3 isoform X2 [Sminthopsis crassicaudata]